MLLVISTETLHLLETSPIRYEITPEGKKATRLDQILLNGNNIAILVPGGDPESQGAEA